MAGLPKKYAKMGFKRGWRAFKASRRKTSYSHRSVAKVTPMRKKTNRGVTMARRKKSSFRRRASSAFKREKALMGGIGYAMIGEPLMDSLAGKIGLGVSDELVKLGAGYVLSKKAGLVGDMGKAMLYINAYKLGTTGFAGIGLGTSTTGAVASSGATF